MNALSRFLAIFRKRKLDADMAEEMRAHIEMQAARNRAAGMSDEDALAAARRRFGGVAQIQERVRDQRGWTWLENLWRDFRFAARSLRKSPGYSLTVTIILTVTIASVALVRLFHDTVLFTTEPLVRNPESLLQVGLKPPGERQWRTTANWPELQEWRSSAKSFSMIAGYYTAPSPGCIGTQCDLFTAAFVSKDFFTTLGVETAIGRTFAEDEFPTVSTNSDTVVISDRLWKNEFGADPNILGRRFDLGIGNLELFPHTVIGVMPPGFEFPNAIDYWVPAHPVGDQFYQINVITRLRADVSRETAETEMATLLAGGETNVEGEETALVALTPHGDQFTSRFERYLDLILWVVLAVQMLACVNIAGLTLARGLQRIEATTIRIALGASRWQIMRQMLVESVLLTAGGLAAGLGVAVAFRPAVVATLKLVGRVPNWWAFSFNPRTLGFTLGIAALTVFAFSLLPAWLYSNPNLTGSVQAASSARQTSRSGWFGSFTIAAQMAVSAVLLIGAALALADLRAFQNVDLGIDARGVAWFVPGPIGLPREEDQAFSYYQQVMREIETSPGITAVGVGRAVPGFGTQMLPVMVERAARKELEQSSSSAAVRWMTPSMLDVLRIQVLHGRRFNDADTSETNPVVLIDQVLADRLFPGDDPLGKRIATPTTQSTPPEWATIVGIVHPTRGGVRESKPTGTVIRLTGPENIWSSTIYVRGNGNWTDTARTAIAAVRRVEPNTVIYPSSDGVSLNDTLENNFWEVRLLGRSMSVFACLSFGIAAVGVYGLVAFAVNMRRREFGIRMTLGATGSRVVRDLMLRIGKIIVTGLVIGAAFAFFFAEKLGYLLEKVDPQAPSIHLTALAFLLAVAAFACWLPARRAARVDPVETLRAE